MAMAVGMVGSCGASGSPVASRAGGGVHRCGRGRKAGRGSPRRLVCSAASASSPCYTAGLTEQYRTLRIQPGASEKEVKKAFRQLALQYHPDVCKGSNCGVQFHQINEAYDIVMTSLRESEEPPSQAWGDDGDDQMRGMYDPSWDLWEEWMGWEGAGIRDYSSLVNPYI
uniref:Chaperone protein dnaJ 8, chloroplastic n=1 Tax=Anthurium amnicola TaxID=1678845 RepID=A0A1D1YLT6_9ARAE